MIIWDAWRRHQITGRLVKKYPLGLTIDDQDGIRHYATFDRVIDDETQQPPAVQIDATATQGSLF